MNKYYRITIHPGRKFTFEGNVSKLRRIFVRLAGWKIEEIKEEEV